MNKKSIAGVTLALGIAGITVSGILLYNESKA